MADKRNREEINCISGSNPQCMHELVEYHAAQTPENLALVFKDQRLSYAELNQRANILAHFLIKQGLQTEMPVGICIDRSVEMIIGLLAVQKAGGAYLPLDPAYPADRLSFMVADAGVTLLLTNEKLRQELPLLDKSGAGENMPGVFSLDSEWEQIKAEAASVENPNLKITPENLAYIIYTSGSTGRPKGVAVTHRGIRNVSDAQIGMFGIGENSKVLQFSSFSFDASVFEIVMAFGAGGTLCLGSREDLLPGENLCQFIKAQKISIVTLPPTALAQMPTARLPNLKTITVAGEACPLDLAARWGEHRQFFNLYGPTETTIWATAAKWDRSMQKMHIGRPIKNTIAYILDKNFQPVAPGESGELFIDSPGMAREYLNRPELNARAFIKDLPFLDDAEKRLYKTGDLVRELPDGNIEFLGRIDQQVKIRGFRIEPGEIEAALSALPVVKQAMVIAQNKQSESIGQRLVAYLVADRDKVPSTEYLRKALQQKLPDYMVPAIFMMLEKLPVTPNGKVDRKALPAPVISRPETIYVAPKNKTETEVAEIWSSILEVEKVSVLDDFFTLGGHSILVIQLVSRIQQRFAVELSMQSVFAAPTVAEISKLIERYEKEKRGKTKISLRQELDSVFPSDRPAILTQRLQDVLAELFGMDLKELKKVSKQETLNLKNAAVELSAFLKKELHLSFFPPELAGYRSTASLAAFVLEELKRQADLPGYASDKPLKAHECALYPAYHPESHQAGKIQVLPAIPGPSASRKNEVLPGMIFVHSAPRSGSTLLRVMLAGHPALFCPPELNLLPFNDLQEMANAYGYGDGYNWPFLGLHTALCELQELTPAQGWALLEKLVAEKRSIYSIYAELLQLSGERQLVEKTIAYGFDSAVLPRGELLFREAKHIHIVRHPSAVIESCVRMRIDRLIHPAHKHPKNQDPYAIAEMTWQKCQENIRHLLNNVAPARQLRIQYEALVNHPEKTMERICDFLEVPFERTMLNPYDNQRRRMITAFGDPNILEHSKIDQKLATSWQSSKTPRRLDQSTTLMASEFGYDISTREPAKTNEAAEEGQPLSFSQERLWFVEQFTPGTAAYNIPVAFRLEGALDAARLSAAIREVIRRQAVLRTIFRTTGGHPSQVILSQPLTTLEITDISNKLTAEREKITDQLIQAAAQQPLDLEKEVPFRTGLIKLAEKTHVFYLTIHHILCDGWSLDILLREIVLIYNASSEEQPEKLPPMPLQFFEFARWQRQRLADETENYAASLNYWKKKLAGAPTHLALPLDQPHLSTGKHRSLRRKFTLPAGEIDELQAIGRSESATLFMVLLAGFYLLLYKLSGQEDVLIGSPIANRPHPDVENIVGFFSSVLVLRGKISRKTSFSEFLKEVRAVCLEAYNFQELPFEKLVDVLQPERDLDRHPLFQVVFASQNTAPDLLPLKELSINRLDVTNGAAKYDLMFLVSEKAGEVEVALEYNADIFNAASIDKMVCSYRDILSAAVTDKNLRIQEFVGIKSTLKNGSEKPEYLTTTTKSSRQTSQKEKNSGFQAPQTSVEKTIAEVWGELLGQKKLSVTDDFFELGGHSLLATQVITHLNETFQIEMPLRVIFEASGMRAFAGKVAEFSGGVDVAEEIAKIYLELELPTENETTK